MALAQGRDRAGQVDLPLAHHLGHPGVGGVCGAVDVRAFELALDGVFLLDPEDAENGAAVIDQGHVLADHYALGQLLVARKRDGDRPEQAVGGLHVDAAAAPVVHAHEPGERRIAAHGEHEEVRCLAARHGHLPERPGPLQFLGALLFWEQKRRQPIAAVGPYQFRHSLNPHLDRPEDAAPGPHLEADSV